MTVRVLVTGAQGFLGRHVVAAWLRSGLVDVCGAGRSTWSNETFTHELKWLDRRVRAPLPPILHHLPEDKRYRYASLDVADEEDCTALISDFRPQIIIHAAAALRDEAWPQLHRSNVQTLISLLRSIARYSGDVPRFVLVSSGSVYGDVGEEDLPIREDAACLPIDLYGVSKRTSEDIARILCRQLSVPLVIVRVFNLLGAGLQDRHLTASLARQIATIHLRLAPPVVAVGPLDTTRDFIEVGDAAKALVVIADRGTPGKVYNAASGRETPTIEIFQELLALCELADSVEIRPLPRRPSDIRRVVADVSRMRNLGVTPVLRLRQALRDMLGYYTATLARAGRVL
jgi:GDP-4-dehydro-6-deoxy-D-mannose reductase